MPFSLGTPAFPYRLLQVVCGYETGVSQFGGVTSERCYQFIRLLARTDLGSSASIIASCETIAMSLIS